MQAKTELRLAIKERLKRLSEHDRSVESRIICKELKKMLGDRPHAVGIYVPFSDEPDIKSLIGQLLEYGWTVCVPSVERNHMVFKRIQSITDVEKSPVTGILEPVHGLSISESRIETVIVPGRAFTASGFRMGRGNGGYDHWIAAQRIRSAETKYIGVCFECQIVQDVPTEAHDQKVTAVLTATKLYTPV